MPLDIQQASSDKGLSPRHFHVFLSSPGDVGEERRIVEEVIQTRLAKDAFLRGRVTFDVISWDDPNAPTPMPANLSPQVAVVRFGRRPAECEIVIVVLWSRLGMHLDTTKFTKPNGEPYLSGTEWEYEDAANADPPPDILLYRRTEKPRIDIDDPEFGAKKKQYDLVNAFLARFRNPDGSFAGSVTNYAAPDALAQRLVSDLTNLLRGRIGVADAAMAERLIKSREEYRRLDNEMDNINRRRAELEKKLDAARAKLDESLPFIFISYAREDDGYAYSIYNRLKDEGLNTWMDKKDLLPGQDWDLQIRTVMQRSDFIILCLSQKSVTKRGYVQKEMKMAMDIFRELPSGSVFLIPVIINHCEIPDEISRYHYIDFRRDDAIHMIFRSIAEEVGRRAAYRPEEIFSR